MPSNQNRVDLLLKQRMASAVSVSVSVAPPLPVLREAVDKEELC